MEVLMPVWRRLSHRLECHRTQGDQLSTTTELTPFNHPTAGVMWCVTSTRQALKIKTSSCSTSSGSHIPTTSGNNRHTEVVAIKRGGTGRMTAGYTSMILCLKSLMGPWSLSNHKSLLWVKKNLQRIWKIKNRRLSCLTFHQVNS